VSTSLEPIVVGGVSKRFGGVEALEGVGLEVAVGETRGLLGPNGAGKTTLLRILFGLLRPDQGEVTLFGRDPSVGGIDFLEGVAGFVEEPSFYPYLTGRQNLLLLAELDGGSDRVRVDDALSRVGLGDAGARKVGVFSTGMRQRLGLAASLLRRPRLLLLDEPTRGLDPAGARQVRTLLGELAEAGVTVLLSSHDMNEVASVCSNVTILHEGLVVWDGTMERLRREAPAPEHRLATSDDERALGLARQDPGLFVRSDPGGGLVVSAEHDALDRYVLSLGAGGVAVRRLELPVTPLESMFFALTGTAQVVEP
jgi:ABC-2 type transport system ATP-binding protein